MGVLINGSSLNLKGKADSNQLCLKWIQRFQASPCELSKAFGPCDTSGFARPWFPGSPLTFIVVRFDHKAASITLPSKALLIKTTTRA